jgi:hypothetical protein
MVYSRQVIIGIKMKSLIAAALFVGFALAHYDRAFSAPTDPWVALSFLEGTWDAHTQGGSAKAHSSGAYTFSSELKHHVMVRRTEDGTACTGPASFDCRHNDVLYVYQDAQDQPLKAIYFDNEGHVIHYDVSTPDSSTAIFISNASPSGPQFQLIYHLKDAVMSGKFQMRMPGQVEWKSYLEWAGAKK